MKNKTFYSVVKGQLIAMWIFGVVGVIFSIGVASEGEDSFFGILGIGFLFFLVFYTIGWVNNKKNNISN